MSQLALNLRTIQNEVRTWLEQKKASKLVLAVSGGVDSMLLLDLFHSLNSQDSPNSQTGTTYEIVVAHVDHGLRQSSKADAEFVIDKSKELGLSFELRVAGQKPANDNLEAWAREVRYGFLKEVCEQHNADLIITAHHASDQVETHLMRLLSGRISRDSNAINPFDERRKIYRPFLKIFRPEILALARERGVNWVEDESNQDSSRLRNKLRHELVPRLEEINPKVSEAILQWTIRLREDEALLWSQAEEFLDKTATIPLKSFLSLPNAIAWRVICLNFECKYGYLAKSIPYKRIKEFCDKIKSSKYEGGFVWELGRGFYLSVQDRNVICSRAQEGLK